MPREPDRKPGFVEWQGGFVRVDNVVFVHCYYEDFKHIVEVGFKGGQRVGEPFSNEAEALDAAADLANKLEEALS